jgi:sarcosine oxidase gamma subunit
VLDFVRQQSHPLVAREHHAVRDAVGVLDMSLMAKLMVQGPHAGAVLNRLSANDVDREIGRLVYTQWLDTRGGIVADVTVSKVADDRFLVISSDITHREIEPRIRRGTRSDEVVVVTDVTSATTLLSVQGPASRELLGRLTDADLSNTAFLVEALRELGAGPDDPAIQRALVFVSRTQNLEGPHNALPFPAKNPDGGFYYTPAAGGESQAGTTPEGGLRSYGSMTYAGLKSMIFAGLTRDDPRVKAATTWLAKHYTFAENPGMGDAGLYYYFHTAAKSLDVLGAETFTDAAGTTHGWRDELSTAIVARQREDGAWKNGNERWMEGETDLATAYALLALSYCLPK